MIITLYGPDTYRRKKKLDELVAHYIDRRANLAFEVVDAEEEGASLRAKMFLETPSLFQDSKLVVIKNAITGMDHGAFKKLFKNTAVSGETTLLLSDNAKQIPKELSFLKEKPNLAQEFMSLDYAGFVSFIRGEAKARSVVIENEAMEYLARAFAGDSWAVVEELDKLSLLSTLPITEDIVKNCGVRVENDFFSYISGWFRKSVSGRLLNLENLLASRNDPAKIFNVLAYQDQNQLRRFADYDVEIKSGHLEYEEALLELALV